MNEIEKKSTFFVRVHLNEKKKKMIKKKFVRGKLPIRIINLKYRKSLKSTKLHILKLMKNKNSLRFELWAGWKAVDLPPSLNKLPRVKIHEIPRIA